MNENQIEPNNIKLPALEEYAPSLERLFNGGIDHQISIPLSLLREELIVLKAQLKSLVGQLTLEQKNTPNFTTTKNYMDPLTEAEDENEDEMSIKSEYSIRIISGEAGEPGTLIVGTAGNGHKRLFKSRPSSQSRQRGPTTQSKQPISVISPSTFWSFIDNGGYFKEIGEEDLNWLETSEDIFSAVSGGIPPLKSTYITTGTPPTGLVERLLSCLMDESRGEYSNLFLLPTNSPPIRTSIPSNIITQRRKKPWDGLYERILWDLRSIGICGPISSEEDMSNEICAALRKCQTELSIISKKNEERKHKIHQILTSNNYLSALEYYRLLDDLDRGIEIAYGRRLTAAVGSLSSATFTSALVAVLNKKALLMRAFKSSNFPKRSKMIKNLGFVVNETGSQSNLLQRIAGGAHTAFGRLLTTTPTLTTVPEDAFNQQSKSEKRRKKK